MIGIHNNIWYKYCNIFADFENLFATDYEKFSAVRLNKSLYLKIKFYELYDVFLSIKHVESKTKPFSIALVKLHLMNIRIHSI